MLGNQRLPIAAIVLLVVVGTVAQVYAAFRGADVSRNFGYVWYFTFSYTVAWWVEVDRRARGIYEPFEYAALMFFFWPLLAPYYLFQSRRWRGLALGLGLIVLALVPELAALAVHLVRGFTE